MGRCVESLGFILVQGGLIDLDRAQGRGEDVILNLLLEFGQGGARLSKSSVGMSMRVHLPPQSKMASMSLVQPRWMGSAYIAWKSWAVKGSMSTSAKPQGPPLTTYFSNSRHPWPVSSSTHVSFPSLLSVLGPPANTLI